MMEPGQTGDGKTVYLVLGIAFFIVIIEWVNYINLATARAITRAREVSIRKAIGSLRKQLVLQFLSESAVMNGIALVLAILIVMIAIPGFNALSGQKISFALLVKYQFWLSLIALFITGIFLSGLYPAFVLSGFKPIEVLKGNMGSTKQNGLLRKSLVVFQFAASLFLLIGTITVYQQIQYMRRQSLGINIKQTLVGNEPMVGIDSTYPQKMTAFKNELSQNTSIKDITVSTSIPGEPVEMCSKKISEIYPELPILTIHDSIVCNISHLEDIKQILENILYEHVGNRTGLKIELMDKEVVMKDIQHTVDEDWQEVVSDLKKKNDPDWVASFNEDPKEIPLRRSFIKHNGKIQLDIRMMNPEFDYENDYDDDMDQDYGINDD